MVDFKENYIIQSTGIFLKSLDRKDSEKYRILRNRKENRECFFTNTEIFAEEQEEWYRRYYVADDEFMFSIYEKDSEQFLGAVAIYHIDRVQKRAEIGRIIIDRSVAGGKGYGKNAICSMIQWGEECLGIESFYANIYADNLPSMKTFLACGFKKKKSIDQIETEQQICVEYGRGLDARV